MLRITDICKQYKTGNFIQKALNHVSLNLSGGFNVVSYLAGSINLFIIYQLFLTIIAMAKGAKHMVTTAKMRSAYAPVSAPAAASAQMPVQPASSPTAPQNVEKDIEK